MSKKKDLTGKKPSKDAGAPKDADSPSETPDPEIAEGAPAATEKPEGENPKPYNDAFAALVDEYRAKGLTDRRAFEKAEAELGPAPVAVKSAKDPHAGKSEVWRERFEKGVADGLTQRRAMLEADDADKRAAQAKKLV